MKICHNGSSAVVKACQFNFHAVTD